MPRFFSLTSVVRASSAVAFLSFAACGGPVEGLPLLVSESSIIDCDANPAAPACQPSCEETGTCPSPGGSTSGSGVTGSISSDFSGVWTGVATYSTARTDAYGNALGYAYTATFSDAVSGGQMVVSKFGVNGDGVITAYGSGGAVTWSGSASVKIGNGGCSTGTVEYTAGTFTVSNGVYAMKLTGVEHWCGRDSAASLTISRATKTGALALNDSVRSY